MPDRYQYSLITPDGATLFLSPDEFAVDIGFPGGFGLPSLDDDVQDVYQQPGMLLKALKIKPRVVTITCTLNSTPAPGRRVGLHELRKRLFSACRWNRTATLTPLTLRYECEGVEADLSCYYAGDTFGTLGGGDNAGILALKLIAYDPLWHKPTATTTCLSVGINLNVAYIIGQIGGAWNAMGGTGTGTVYCILVSSDGDTVYVGGDFGNWAGLANADCIAKYTVSTGTWAALGTGMNAQVRALALAPDGTLYAGGYFTTAGGNAAAGVAKWNGTAWSALGAGVTGGSAYVHALALSPAGILYVGGSFTTAGIFAASNIAKYSTSASLWAPMGAGVSGPVNALAIGWEGVRVYAGGNFLTAGTDTANSVAVWYGNAWHTMSSGVDSAAGVSGGGGVVNALAVGVDGSIYAGGSFTTAGGNPASNIAQWYGEIWWALGDGVNNTVTALASLNTGNFAGTIYAGGTFTTAGDITVTDAIATWNGSTWAAVSIDLPGTPTVSAIAVADDLYLGFNTTGVVEAPDVTEVAMLGDHDAYPVFEFTGPGTLEWIANNDSGKEIWLDCYLDAGETATMDLRPGVKTWGSNIRSNLFPYATVLPQSDFGTFALAPDPIAAAGINHLQISMSGDTPVEFGDDDNQVSDYENMTGVTCDNIGPNGVLWMNVIGEGGARYRVDFYMGDNELVATTGTYTTTGAKTIIPLNGSGIGGTITIDAIVGVCLTGRVYFATAKCTHYDAYLSADAAVQR